MIVQHRTAVPGTRYTALVVKSVERSTYTAAYPHGYTSYFVYRGTLLAVTYTRPAGSLLCSS